MSKIIERVAKDIYEFECNRDEEPYDWNVLSKDSKRLYIVIAAVAIKAMLEPTKEMIEAGCENNPTMWNDGTDDGFAAGVANDVYRAMIKEALK